MPSSIVVSVRLKGILSSGPNLDEARLRRAFEAGFRAIFGTARAQDGLLSLFPPSEKVGIKINTIGGRALSTRREVSLALAGLLSDSRPNGKDVVIWDRTNRELQDAGYKLSLVGAGPKVLGTDSAGFGYDTDITSHLNIGSRFSTIQSRMVDSSISLALLKDHGMAGLTAGMKNYFGAIHNPNKYHDANCNPFVAELMDTPPIRSKHKLTILDALTVQCHRGPSFHARWAVAYESLVFSRDPVAADYVGWSIIDRLRAERGLASLKDDGREPAYIATAEKMGLGAAQESAVRVVEVEA